MRTALFVALLLPAFLQASATSFGQSITLNKDHVTLKEVFRDIQSQSGYDFVFSDRLMKNAQPLSVHIKNGTLETVLRECFKNQPFTYTMEDKTIIVKQLLNTKPAFSITDPGKITGRIIDDKGEALVAATIKIIETGQGLQSGIDGTYQLSLAPGTYTLEVSYISYQTKKITGVVVTAGKSTSLNIMMTAANKTLHGVVVTSDYKRTSVEGLYAKQKNNAAITDGISAEQIARTPDKNIGETLKRISGVNVLENKFVVVRGLGERYNSTVMNGEVMPSTELNRKQFSFDIIPSNMVDNITIYKTINADKNAEFGGGLVEVNTKSIPTENFFNISVGGNYNDHTTGKNFRGLNISGPNYWGNMSDDRKLLGKTDWKSQNEYMAYYASKGNDAKLFFNNWQLHNYKPGLSPNLQASLGRVIEMKNNDKLGIIASVSYRNTWQTSDVISGRNGYTGSDKDDELYGFTGKRYGFTTNLGGIAGIGYTHKQFKIGVQSMLIRTYDQQLVLGTGVKDDVGESVGYYDLTTQTHLWQNQLTAEKVFGKRGIKLNALVSYSLLDKQKPDNHQFDALYMGSEKDDPLNPASDFSIANIRSNLIPAGVLRSWSRTHEKNTGLNLDLVVPVKFNVLKTAMNNSIKTGYSGWTKDRFFWVANTSSFGFVNGSNYAPLSQAFDPALYPDPKVNFIRFGDDFHKKATLHAGYVMLDSKVGRKFRITAGLRGEYYDLNKANALLDTFVIIQRASNNDSTDYSAIYGTEPKFNLFRSASLTYALTPQMNLRAAYAESIIRPDLRELSYFKEYDYELGGSYVANTPVRSTKIKHYDLRYEWYPGPGEIVSLSYFYKKLAYPMEVYDLGNRQYELRNDQSAENKGFEIDVRKNFAFTGVSIIKHITLYGNFTRLYAKVVPMKVTYHFLAEFPHKMLVFDNPLPKVERPQAGASNYTYNAGINYDDRAFSLSMGYNYVANRVFRASENYQECLFETPLPTLDAQLAYRFFHNKASVKLNFSNLLNKSTLVYQNRYADPEIGGGRKAPGKEIYYQKGDKIDYKGTPGRTYGFVFNYNF